MNRKQVDSQKPGLNPNVNLDIKTLENVKCSNCGGEIWQSAVILKKVSALLTETGKPGFIPVPTWSCVSCNNINDEINPLKVV